MRSSGTSSDPTVALAANFDAGDGSRPRYNTPGSRVLWPPRPLASERTLGIIVTGQSSIANWGSGTLYTAVESRSHNLNIADGRVYAMADPVLGCDGTGGCLASALGDLLIADDKWDRVTLANAAWGTTRSSQWAPSTGTLAQGLKAAWEFFKAHRYENVVHIHQQGEGDAADGVSFATMRNNLRLFDRWRLSYGISCPLYISQTTFQFDWDTSDPDPENWTPGADAQAIRAAQLAVVNGDSILSAPDTDTVRGPGLRTTAHPDTQACNLALAQLWADTLPAAV